MNRNLIVGLVVALVVVVGGIYFYSTRGQSNQSANMPVVTQPSPTQDASSSQASGSAGQTAGTVKELTVNGSNFKFEPSTLTVSKGDTVKITFNSSGGMHDFVIDEFNVKTSVIKSGASETVQFIADKTGTFQYYCSVGNHRAMGMQGTLTVQ